MKIYWPTNKKKKKNMKSNLIIYLQIHYLKKVNQSQLDMLRKQKSLQKDIGLISMAEEKPSTIQLFI